MMLGFLFSLLPESTRRRVVRWLEENRGLVIVLFCLPASLLFDLALGVHRRVLRLLDRSQSHEERVAAVQRAVRHWQALPPSQRRPMCSARPNWLSLSTKFTRKAALHRVPVPLHRVLGLDAERRVVSVEPLVTVAEAVDFLLPRGFVLAVTLEIGDATLGGLALGVGMTTHSHRVGLYQEAIEAAHVVLPDASVVVATADNEHRDLFRCLPWSHGSLGLLVRLDLRVVPAKPYVRLQYIPVRGKAQYCDRMRELSGARDPNIHTPDFVEATVFSKDEAVVMAGNFADVDNVLKWSQVNPVARWYKPWFYKHVESILRRGQVVEEYVPLRDYLLRHNRAIFWVLESMIPFGNHPLFRLLLGWLCPPKPAFLKFTTTPGVRAMTFTRQVFQDIVLPMTELERSIDLAEELFDTYPILIYPCRVYDHGPEAGQLRAPRSDQMCPRGGGYGMFYDLGVYGTPGPVRRRERYDCVDAMRRMEKFIRDVGGYSFLYADIFMTREEFDVMFDLALYERVRKKYQMDGAFPHLFEKVKPEVDVFAIGREWANKDD